MSLSESLTFITRHPLCRQRRLSAITRFAAWQVRSRLSSRPYLFPWIDDARLLLERGVAAGTGNLYVGLHEYAEMGFLLHFLRPGDLFVDIGANVGTYTILASGVCGARTLTFEPVPATYERLRKNVAINGLQSRVETRMEAVGAEQGRVAFTTAFDSVNHVLSSGDSAVATVEVPVVTLTSAVKGQAPVAIKIDVEGFETAVFDGGEEVFANPSLQALIVELNGCGSRYGYNDDALHERIVRFGYAPADYDPRGRRLEGARDRNGRENVLYVRDFDAARRRVDSAPTHRIHALNARI